MSLVEIKDLSVSYDGVQALAHVDLQILPGDFLGVIGPNGGGKTTLVKAILGAVNYTGTISYSDSICRRGKNPSSRTPLIGYLPQQEKFDPAFPITVKEVVLSGLQSQNGLWDRYTRSDRERAAQLLEMAGIGAIGEKSISKISGGQLQRALLCRALISDPPLLILDEPANFVDNKFEKELYEILRRLNREQGKAIIMVSHDLGTVSSVVKSIVCVNRRVHRHNSNRITAEQLHNYDCPIQLVYHGNVPHTVLEKH
jgi:zinc transport system ATP-binding protein